MPTYTDLGYSRFLERPISQASQSTINQDEFVRYFPNIPADKVKGGVLDMGGHGNGDGYIKVKDAQGNPNVVIDNQGINVKGKGRVKLNDTATVWNDYMIPAFSVRNGATPPDLESGFGGNANLFYLAFAGITQEEYVFFTLQLPHDYKEGSTIYPHVHFVPTSTNTGDTTSRAVRFYLLYTWANINGTFGTGSTIYLDSDGFVPNTSQWKHLLCKNSTGISGTSKTLSSMLVCKLGRNYADSADTYPQDVAFLQFDIHYEIDAIGSEGEYTKYLT